MRSLFGPKVINLGGEGGKNYIFFKTGILKQYPEDS